MTLLGEKMYSWLHDLFPINRSLTGPGNRDTLEYLSSLLENKLLIRSVPSGTKAFDWTIPDEWEVDEAWIKDSHGNTIVDFKNNNLHVVGYSIPVDKVLDLAELEQYLHSIPDQPDAIPYVTSYYSRNWGFCLTHNQRVKLSPGKYHVVIKSKLFSGVLNYGEIILPGQSKEEVFLSTYICHPSMANNELSGPVVTTALAQWLMSCENRRYTYRIIFIPETIGSILYLSIHMEYLIKHVIAGFNISCVGDNRCYSFLPSRDGNTLSDRTAKHVLKHIDPSYKVYKWLDRGSDERQYCSPGVDLPISTIMRSKYTCYPEYHTSLDDLNLVSPEGLTGAFSALKSSIQAIECNCSPITTVFCEPQLGKRNLCAQSPANKKTGLSSLDIRNILTYCDGRHDLLEIADSLDANIDCLIDPIKSLFKESLLKIPFDLSNLSTLD